MRCEHLRVFGMLFLLVAACWLSTPAAVVRAQTDSSNVAYRDSIERAIDEFNRGNWEEAYALFKRAHELQPSARTLRGLGVAAYEMRMYVEAIRHLEAALSDTRMPLPTESRSHAYSLLGHAREFVSILKLHLSPAQAEIHLDGRKVTLDDGQLAVNPGPHTLNVRAQGYREQWLAIHPTAGAREELTVELVAGDAVTSSRETIERPVQPAGAERARRPWTWALASATVASAGVAVGLRVGVKKLERKNRACELAREDCGAVVRQGDRLLLSSRAMAGVTGAFVIGTVVALLIEPRPTSTRSVALLVGPRSLSIGGTF